MLLFVPQGTFSWAALHSALGAALPPSLLPGSSRTAPCALVLPGKELSGLHGMVLLSLSAPSTKPLCSGSPWFFPVLSRLPALLYHSADKGTLWFPPALGWFMLPGSPPCVRSLLLSVVSSGFLPTASVPLAVRRWAMVKTSKNVLFSLLVLLSLCNLQSAEIRACICEMLHEVWRWRRWELRGLLPRGWDLSAYQSSYERASPCGQLVWPPRQMLVV